MTSINQHITGHTILPKLHLNFLVLDIQTSIAALVTRGMNHK